MRIRARHYGDNQLIDVVCAGGKIQSIQPPSSVPVDFEAGWAAPAFFDLQINGCDGKNFSSERLTVDDVRHITGVCRRHGISGFYPTLITNSFAALRHGMATIAKACDSDSRLAYSIPAIHLEGPYISPDDGPRGAHPKEHVRPPDWDEFCRLQEASGKRIRLVTLAPEWPQATAFIEQLVKNDVVVSLAHTAANGQQIRDAVSAGARLSTHLGNGSHAVLPRHDNYIWEQLACDELWASIICDGHHLPPAVVKCMTRVKTPARLILTCDASPLAGLPPGRYHEFGQDFEILADGKVTVAGTSYLGGSGAFTDICVGNVIRFAGVSLKEAVDMAGAQPRQLLELPAQSLNVGEGADLVLFDWDETEELTVTATMIQGRLTNAAGTKQPISTTRKF